MFRPIHGILGAFQYLIGPFDVKPHMTLEPRKPEKKFPIFPTTEKNSPREIFVFPAFFQPSPPIKSTFTENT